MTNVAPETSISDHASAMGEPPSADASAIADRLAKVESLIEQVGQYSALIGELNAYVADCRQEISSVRRIRKWAVGSSVFIILVWALAGAWVVFYQPFSLWMVAPQFKTYVTLGIIAASTLILSVILKGAFRTIADRHGDDSLPPHIKEAVEALKPLKDIVK